MAARSPKDISALMEDGRAVDRAVNNAFADAVRRHRQAGVPMAMWENGRTVLVSPFDVRLPGEEEDAASDEAAAD
jgi:hypothetical protein